jgi:hypothetical protein
MPITIRFVTQDLNYLQKFNREHPTSRPFLHIQSIDRREKDGRNPADPYRSSSQKRISLTDFVGLFLELSLNLLATQFFVDLGLRNGYQSFHKAVEIDAV